MILKECNGLEGSKLINGLERSQLMNGFERTILPFSNFLAFRLFERPACIIAVEYTLHWFTVYTVHYTVLYSCKVFYTVHYSLHSALHCFTVVKCALHCALQFTLCITLCFTVVKRTSHALWKKGVFLWFKQWSEMRNSWILLSYC